MKKISILKTIFLKTAFPVILTSVAVFGHSGVVLANEAESVSEPVICGLGYIESPDYEEVPIVGRPNDFSGIEIYGASPYYNAYELGLLPAIRNQGQTDTCWAFASVGCVETDLIMGGAGTDIDLSELQIAFFTSHMYDDPTDCHDSDTVRCNSNWISNGGCAELAYRAMMEGIGLIPESEMPFRYGSELNGFAPSDDYAYGHNVYQIKGAYLINIKDSEGIKYAILEHGGVATSLYMDYSSTYYNSDTNAYCTPYTNTNHAVMLVGWDDNFPKENFNSSCMPSSNGAWLVRNSWGSEGYGKYGYFWLSYEDTGLNTRGQAVAFDADGNTFDRSYAYFRNFHPGARVTIPVGTKVRTSFTTICGESINAIGFETNESDFTATAIIRAGDDMVTGSVNTSFAGFYTIYLDRDLAAAAGTEVTIELSFSKAVKLFIENPASAYYSTLYMSNTCEKGFDLIYEGGYTYHEAYDPMIMMYTSDIELTGLSLDSVSLEMNVGENKTLTVTTTPPVVTDSQFTWSSSNPDVAAVDSAGNVTAKKIGEAMITVTASDGKTASCNISVTFKPLPDRVEDGKILLYRMYNPNSGEHFWTGSGQEVYDLVYAGWNFEGDGWWAPLEGAPVYRLYNPNAGDHHYTMDADERDMLVNSGWSYEGKAWNSASPDEGYPLYRLYNPNAESGSHHLTASEQERDNLAAIGWVYEGVSCHGL